MMFYSTAPPACICVLVLFLICLLNTSNYFAYHAPGAIAQSIQDNYNLSTQQFGSLFTIYSAPNIILVFLSGRAIDRYGIKLCSVLFNSSMLLGMILFALTPYHTAYSYYLLLIGRLLLGLGGESIVASAQVMIGKWFNNDYNNNSIKHNQDEYNLQSHYNLHRKTFIGLTAAMGVNQAAVQLFGSAAAFALLPLISSLSLSLANWMSVVACAISLLANLIYIIFEYEYADYLEENEALSAFSSNHNIANLSMHNNEFEYKPIQTVDYNASPGLHSILTPHNKSSTADGNHFADFLDESHHQYQSSEQYHLTHTNSNGIQSSSDISHLTAASLPVPIAHSASSSRRSSLSAAYSSQLNQSDSFFRIPSFSLLFWLVILMQSCLSPILYTFTAFGPLYLQEKFHLTVEESGFATSLLYIAIVAAPIFGFIIDNYGKRAIIQLIASCNIPLAFLALHYQYVGANIGMSYLGVAFAITESNGLAMIVEYVESNVLGTAYGILGCLISLALLIEPLAVGTIYEYYKSFDQTMTVFVILSLIGVLSAFFIFLFDKKNAEMKEVEMFNDSDVIDVSHAINSSSTE
jgi:MFS family permease